MSVSLVAAATDRRLFAADFHLWPRQVELLASLDGPERTHIWSVDRQAGKTTMAAMCAIHNAALRPDLDSVLPRRRTRYVLIACPGQDQSREFISVAEGIVKGSSALSAIASFSADQIDFDLGNGRRSCIRAMPANARTVRGRSSSLVVCDEFGWFSETAGPGSDEKMYKALRPSMRRFGDRAKMLLISTPSGESGRFYELFRDAESGVLPSAVAVHLPVWEVDPSYDETQREADRAELGEDGFAAECGAEFVAAGSTFFNLGGIPMDVAPAPPSASKNWVCGLDPAFSQDMWGLAIVGESVSEPGVLVVGAVAALKPARAGLAANESFEVQRAREDSMMQQVLEILLPYRPRCVSDLHKGGPVRTFLGRHGISVRLDQPSKPLELQRFVSTKSRLEDRSLRLWSHSQLVQDLRRIRTSDAGMIHLPRARGSHCDAAVALSIATWEHRGATGVGSGEARAGGGSLLSDDGRTGDEWLANRGAGVRRGPPGEPPPGGGADWFGQQQRSAEEAFYRRPGGILNEEF